MLPVSSRLTLNLKILILLQILSLVKITLTKTKLPESIATDFKRETWTEILVGEMFWINITD